jgi:hypothetical protein
VPAIEYVILCDHAENNNGKLNMLGGGWTATARQIVTVTGADPLPPPQIIPSRFAIALSVDFSWFEAGDPISFQTTIKTEDEHGPPIWNGGGQVQTGRPPGAPKGSSFRAIIVFLVLLPFPRPGGYVVHTVLAGADAEHKLPFQVIDQPIMVQAAPNP